MADLGRRFERTEVDGIPTYWASLPGPCTGALMFRVGRSDETLATCGITHLVEHLALFPLGTPAYEFNGVVDDTRATFFARGTEEQVAGFLARTAAALSELPLDRLGAERRVLAAEEAADPGSVLGRVLAFRYGASTFGLTNYRELGLRRVGEDEVAAWARDWFTRENAALCFTTEPPDVRLELPAGRRRPPAAPEPIADLELPVFVSDGTGGMAATFVVPRSSALSVAMTIAGERIHRSLRLDRGLIYDVTGESLHMTADLTHASHHLGCRDEDAVTVQDALLAIYDELAGDGPTEQEMERDRELFRTAMADDESAPGGLDYLAMNELFGAPVLYKEDLLAEHEKVTPAAAAQALAAALETALVLAPEVTPKPARALCDYPWHSKRVVDGKTYRPRGLRNRGKAKLIVGEEGLTWFGSDPDRPATVLFSECVAAVHEEGGALTVIDRDMTSIQVHRAQWRGGDEVLRAIEAALPERLFIPAEDEADRRVASVESVAAEKLPSRTYEAALAELAQRLEDGERLITLAEAARGWRFGMLAVTDRRLLFASQTIRGEPGEVVEHPRASIERADGSSGLRHGKLRVAVDGGWVEFTDVDPKERAAELADALRGPR